MITAIHIDYRHFKIYSYGSIRWKKIYNTIFGKLDIPYDEVDHEFTWSSKGSTELMAVSSLCLDSSVSTSKFHR